MTVPTETGRFALGDLKLQSGEVLPDATLSWKSYGTLSPSRDNVIVYPTSYTAKHSDQEWLIAPDKVLDPTRWFIVTPDMFGNGLSSSPSNTADYPNLVTATDNVCAQRRFLSEQFGIDRIAAVYGFSMGAQQAYHWAALYPDAVERAIIVAGSARTSTHNKVFLLSLFAALEAAPEYLGGIRYAAEPTKALRTFANLCRLGDEPLLVSPKPASQCDRRDRPRGLPHQQMGAGLHRGRRRKSARTGADLAEWRYQRQRPLWR